MILIPRPDVPKEYLEEEARRQAKERGEKYPLTTTEVEVD